MSPRPQPQARERKPCTKCGRPRPTKEHIDDNVNHPIGCACDRCTSVCWGGKADCEDAAHLRLVAIESDIAALKKALADVQRLTDILWSAPKVKTSRAIAKQVRR